MAEHIDYEKIPMSIFKLRRDDEWTVQWANSRFYSYIRMDKNSFEKNFNSSFLALVSYKDVNSFTEKARYQFESGISFADEIRLQCGSDEVWSHINAGLIIENDESFLMCALFNVEKPKRMQKEKEEIKKRYELMLNQTSDIAFEVYMPSRDISYSQNFQKRFGYRPTDKDFPYAVIKNKHISESDGEILLAAFHQIENGTEHLSVEIRINSLDGDAKWSRVTMNGVRDREGHLEKIIGLITDIDQHKRSINMLSEKADHNGLTGLYNRTRTKALIEEHLMNNSAKAAMIMIDIDNFKAVNDNYGHLYGDGVLSQMGRIMMLNFRGGDVLGRMGGDEFCIFVKNISDMDDFAARIEKVVDMVGGMFEEKAGISISVGVAIYPSDTDTFEGLYAMADAALYESKRNGKNRISFYHGQEFAGVRNSTPIDGVSNYVNLENFKADVFSQAFSNYSRWGNLGDVIYPVMEKLRIFTSADRISAFEFSVDMLTYKNMFESCAEGIETFILHKEDSIGADYLKLMDLKKVYVVNSTKKLPMGAVRNWLEERSTKTAIAYMLSDAGKNKGCLIIEYTQKVRLFDERELNDYYAASELLIQLLLSFFTRSNSEKLFKMYKGLIYDAGSYIYVTANGGYKLLYAGEKMREDKKIRADLPCYEVIYNRNYPCESCPKAMLIQNEGKVSFIKQEKDGTNTHVMCLKTENGNDAIILTKL